MPPSCGSRRFSCRSRSSCSAGTEEGSVRSHANLPNVANHAVRETLLLEFLVRPHGIFIDGRLSAPLAVVKVLKTLDLRCAQAATAIAGDRWTVRVPISSGFQATG